MRQIRKKNKGTGTSIIGHPSLHTKKGLSCIVINLVLYHFIDEASEGWI